jgi:hypothetical protein
MLGFKRFRRAKVTIAGNITRPGHTHRSVTGHQRQRY